MSVLECMKYNEMLMELGLVSWTSGNVSISDGKNLYIKPSGILFKDVQCKACRTIARKLYFNNISPLQCPGSIYY